MPETKPVEVIIIGAGIAGLATAYGLQHTPGIHVRVIEKRQEHECQQGGYPIHLSADGRDALQKLLTPQDHLRLLHARSKLPGCHDGITMIKSSGKISWRMVSRPGEKCLLERQDLIDILREGLSPPDPIAGVQDTDEQDILKVREREREAHEALARKWRKALETTYDAKGLLGDSVETWRQVADWARVDRESLVEVDHLVVPRGGVLNRGRPGRADRLALAEKTVEAEAEIEAERVADGRGVVVEYAKSVKTITKTSAGWDLILWDGETASCNLLIGADGMFSTLRRTLYPPTPGSKDPGFQALPWTIINLRTSSPAVRQWVKDPDGMCMVYGKGWSAALGALGTVSGYDELHPARVGHGAGQGLGQADKHGHPHDQAHHQANHHSQDHAQDHTHNHVHPDITKKTNRSSWFRNRKNTSQGSSPASSNTPTLHPDNPTETDPYAPGTHSCSQEPHSKSNSLAAPTQPVRKEPSPHGVYVALTIAHPRGTLHEAISSLPEARPSTSTRTSFLRDLLADPNFHTAQAFPLWTSRTTCAGGQRAVLIGDASHGMVPYCGAGASAGLKDAVELVDLLHNHLLHGGNLDYLLNEFYALQKARNDPLIAQSRKVLWLAQGDNLVKRIIRSVAFGTMEVLEKTGKGRKEAEVKLARWKNGMV